MRRALSNHLRRLIRRGEVGQTIVIMAFGFVVLLAFVGIVTDVSLMFVRYSTLRRAVDSAAVAAAGQLRRTVPTNDEIVRANAGGGTQAQKDARAQGYAFARNFATVNLAARQFIGLYGLNPTTVTVDTCATLPGDPELCTADQRKLVRVTAQVNSPTIFLRLIGWGNITLEAAAISETAVLDVVMIFDVSESMLNQTSYMDWEAVPIGTNGILTGGFANLGMRYAPPRMAIPWSGGPTVTTLAGTDWSSLWYQTLALRTYNDLRLYDPTSPYRTRAFIVTNPTTNATQEVLDWNDPRHPRADCRVRFFPSSGSFTVPNGQAPYHPRDDIRVELARFYGIANYPSTWDGFMPAYNFFGCCNDPNGDGDFTDLVCQPFQEVRNASEQFLQRIDFVRGDRVAFVTFDRSAHLMLPAEPYNNPGQADDASLTFMMDNEDAAIKTLRQSVGVRAERTFYADTDFNGKWDSFAIGGGEYIPGDPNSAIPMTYTLQGPPGGVPTAAGGFNLRPLGQYTDYPVKDNCMFQNATLSYPFSLFASPPNTSDPLYNIRRLPNALAANVDPIMHPNFNIPAWNALIPRDPSDPTRADPNFPKALFNYELRAGCRGGNIGAALRQANNALLDPKTVRTNGAVWVMVMLGDGGAAGSDPVLKGGRVLQRPNPYTVPPANPAAGEYGAFGLCPYGTPGDRGELVSDWNDKEFPFCSDEDFASRNFCFDPRNQDARGNIYIDLASDPQCEPKYDVDDYARDWADYVGLLDPYPWLNVGSTGRSDLQLPTIFTIGFGLDFNSGDGSCDDNIPDCLGEELLRYIADVGDNFQIDSDYQQDWRDNKRLDHSIAADDWGLRSPCEDDIVGYASPEDVPPANYSLIINPRAEGDSCGNYYNAPSGRELERVFDEIASRMFTRLAR